MDAPEAQRFERALAATRQRLAENDGDAAAWHDAGVLHQRSGDLIASRDAFERAVALDASFASAHNNLGNTYTLLGELESAVASYRRAIACDATLAQAHANAAAALHVIGRHADARSHARAALECDPENVAIRITAALIETAVNGTDAGLDVLDGVLTHEPGNVPALAARAYLLLGAERFAEAHGTASAGLAIAPSYGLLLETLGCALRGLGRFPEAFAAFDRAYELGHDRANVLVLKAGGLLETGAFDAARAALETALDVAPGLASAWSALADVRAFRDGDPAIATMETALAESPQLRAVEPRTLMHFALGKAYRKAGAAERAFHHFASGNALKRATLDYDVARDERLMRDTRHAFTRAIVYDAANAGTSTRAPIFVVGMVRSGTTLIEQILASHPGVYGAGELTLFDRAVDECATDDMDALGRRYIALLDAIAPPEKRVVDKLPSNFRHAGLIRLALPNARIIHCLRDPLDTCFSAFITLFTGRQDFAFDLIETGRYYRAYAALMEHWRAVLPPGFMLDVRYEDMIADLETNARRILAFCGLPWNDAVLRFHETERTIRTASFHQARQPLYRTSVGAAEPYRAFLQPLIDELDRL